jgi:hypothetical protein
MVASEVAGSKYLAAIENLRKHRSKGVEKVINDGTKGPRGEGEEYGK